MRRIAVLVVAVLITACPGNQPEDSSQNAPAKNTTSTQNPQSVPERSSSMNPIAPPQGDLPASRIAAAASQSVDIQLTEYGILIPETLKAGQYRFRVSNAGKEAHNFVIEGNGIGSKLMSDLSRGNTAEMIVDLKPGKYTVFCPVDGHRGKGMRRVITVQ